MVLELPVSLDSSRLEAGARRGQTALQQFGNAAVSATQRTVDLGSAQQRAFGVTGGGLAIASGVKGVSDAMRNMDTAMASISASRIFLDFARMQQDFKDMRVTAVGATGAVGGLRGGLRALGAVIRANPIMTLALVLGTVTTAMIPFIQKTETAATAWQELGDSIKKAQAEIRVGAVFSKGDVYTSSIKSQQEAMFQAAVDLDKRRSSGEFETQILGDLFTKVPFLRKIPYGDLLTPEQVRELERPRPVGSGQSLSLQPTKPDPENLRVSVDQAIAILARGSSFVERFVPRQDDDIQTQRLQTFNRVGSIRLGRDRGQFGGNEETQRLLGLRLNESIEQQGGERLRLPTAEELQAMRDSMDAMNESARQFGEYIGDAVADLAFGLTDAATALRRIGMDLARQMIRSSVGSLASSFFPSSEQQATINTPGESF